MRQLLILAIESPDPLSITHLSLNVPGMIDKARGNGELLQEPFTPKAVADAAKRCMGGLFEHANVGIHPEMTRGEHVAMGLRLLAGMVETLDGVDAMVGRGKPDSA